MCCLAIKSFLGNHLVDSIMIERNYNLVVEKTTPWFSQMVGDWHYLLWQMRICHVAWQQVPINDMYRVWSHALISCLLSQSIACKDWGMCHHPTDLTITGACISAIAVEYKCELLSIFAGIVGFIEQRGKRKEEGEADSLQIGCHRFLSLNL